MVGYIAHLSQWGGEGGIFQIILPAFAAPRVMGGGSAPCDAAKKILRLPRDQNLNFAPFFWYRARTFRCRWTILKFCHFFWTGQGLVAADGPFLNFATFLEQGKDWSLPMDLS
jgi:hypothetical protein